MAQLAQAWQKTLCTVTALVPILPLPASSHRIAGYSTENSPAIFIRGGEPWLMGYCWRIYSKVLEGLFLSYVSQAFLPSKEAC